MPFPCQPPGPPIFKIFNIHHRKKKKLCKIYFSMGTVLVIFIFSFFGTDNDLVCALPPPYCGIPPQQFRTYFGTHLKNYSHDFPEILGSSKQYKGKKLALTKKHDILPFAGSAILLRVPYWQIFLLLYVLMQLCIEQLLYRIKLKL